MNASTLWFFHMHRVYIITEPKVNFSLTVDDTNVFIVAKYIINILCIFSNAKSEIHLIQKLLLFRLLEELCVGEKHDQNSCKCLS